MSTFIISDTHFGHENVCRRIRHMSAEESDKLIISNWNRVVHKHDKVFLLGDVTMDKPEIIKKIIPQLNGSIHVILGNHDTARCVKALVECGCKVSACEYYNDFVLTHIPIEKHQFGRYRGNIHGHIHHHEKEWSPGRRYYNVNCEMHDYTPIKWEDVVKEFERKERKGLFRNIFVRIFNHKR